jgi:hypothetical protein
VLVGRHPALAGTGPVEAAMLEGERVAVIGHRGALGYDQAVADLLDELGIAAELIKVGSGPALQAAVARGDAVALSTAPAALHPEVTARALQPRRVLRFALLWRQEASSPALTELIRLAAESAERTSAPRRLMAVA